MGNAWGRAHPERLRELQRIARRRRRIANPEKFREAARQWRLAHHEVERTRERERSRQRRLENPVAHRAASRKSRVRHRDERIAKSRIRYAADPQKALDAVRRSLAKNLNAAAIASAYVSRRRARKAGNGGSHTGSEWITLCWFESWQCVYCARVLDAKTATRDHKIPITRGGSDDISNITVSCKPCNSRKSTLTVEEFLARRAA